MHKPRQPRLRASCDGCFLAKVKCSKERPACGRCLQVGIRCHYSPSSRAGKPKAENSHSHISTVPHGIQHMLPILDNRSMAFSNQPTQSHTWGMPPASVEGTTNASPCFQPNIGMFGGNQSMPNQQQALPSLPSLPAAPDFYQHGMNWNPATNMEVPNMEITNMEIPNMDIPNMDIPNVEIPNVEHTYFDVGAPIQDSHSQPQPFDLSTMGMQTSWADTKPQEVASYPQVQTPTSMGSNYFSSPTTTPNVQSTISYQQHASPCPCFALCVGTLQSLHDASIQTPMSFDVIMDTTRRSAEACTTILDCLTCFTGPEAYIVTMLFATILAKIASMYRCVAQLCSEPGTVVTVSQNIPTSSASGDDQAPNTFDGGDGGWSKMEMIGHGLQKVDEIHKNFSSITRILGEQPYADSLCSWIGQILNSTRTVVCQGKIDSGFVT